MCWKPYLVLSDPPVAIVKHWGGNIIHWGGAAATGTGNIAQIERWMDSTEYQSVRKVNVKRGLFSKTEQRLKAEIKKHNLKLLEQLSLSSDLSINENLEHALCAALTCLWTWWDLEKEKT